MSCTKAMLSVIMDGIKDANMILDYAEEAATADNSEAASWFKAHAKKRIDSLEDDSEYVSDYIGIDEKIKAGDEIAVALESHLEEEMQKLHNRLSALKW